MSYLRCGGRESLLMSWYCLDIEFYGLDYADAPTKFYDYLELEDAVEKLLSFGKLDEDYGIIYAGLVIPPDKKNFTKDDCEVVHKTIMVTQLIKKLEPNGEME